MEKINRKNELAEPKETDISRAVEELIYGPVEADASVEEITKQIDFLKNFLAEYNEKVVDKNETYQIIESAAKRVTELESKLSMIELLKRHPSLA